MSTSALARAGTPTATSAGPAVSEADAWRRFSDGEVHFLYWFIQGRIMVPDTRWRLRRGARCGTCLGISSAARCRSHFREEAARGRGDVRGQRELVGWTVEHLPRYRRSFVWDHRGTETDEDRAALIAAVGWCSGWRELAAFAADEPGR